MSKKCLCCYGLVDLRKDVKKGSTAEQVVTEEDKISVRGPKGILQKPRATHSNEDVLQPSLVDSAHLCAIMYIDVEPWRETSLLADETQSRQQFPNSARHKSIVSNLRHRSCCLWSSDKFRLDHTSDRDPFDIFVNLYV